MLRCGVYSRWRNHPRDIEGCIKFRIHGARMALHGSQWSKSVLLLFLGYRL